MNKLLALFLTFFLQLPCIADGLPVGSATSTVPGSAIQSGTVNTGQLATNFIQHAQFSLTSSQILNLFATPITVLSAPGSGKYYNILSFSLIVTKGATAYTGGGNTQLKDAGGNTLASISNATINTTNSGGRIGYDCNRNIIVNTSFNSAVTITNATGAFVTGDGTAVGDIFYQVIP